MIMIGGQILIIFVGGEAFKIVPLTGKEWGLSIGLGAISLPWGALIRKFPDEWARAMTPHFTIPVPNFRRRKKNRKPSAVDIEKAPSSQSEEDQKKRTALESDTDFEPPAPLRTLTSIRGKRASSNIKRGFREYAHDKKAQAKAKVKAKVAGGSKTDVTVGGEVPAAKA
jgi:Ca2+-transporting ATPase